MNSGNPDSKGIIKTKTEVSVMQNRIGFVSDDSRKNFFLEVRNVSGVKSWDALAKLFNICRSQFQSYQYGKTLLPEKLFNKTLGLLSEEKQDYFLNQTVAKPANWGMIKGGINNYKKNSEKIIAQLRKGFQRKVESGWPSKPVDLNMPLSEELCEFIGAVIGDGYIDGYLDKTGRSHYHIGIIGDSELDREYHLGKLSKIVKDLFDVKTRPYFRKDARALQLNIFSKQIFKLLTERFGFPTGVKAHIIKIPDEIMASEERFIFAAIRGIFDTDGNVFIDKRKIYKEQYGRITLRTISQPLHDQLKEFLKKYFSFYSSVIKTEHAPTRQIAIYRREQIEKWMHLIGFSNQRHLTKIEELLKPLEGFEPPTCALQEHCSSH